MTFVAALPTGFCPLSSGMVRPAVGARPLSRVLEDGPPLSCSDPCSSSQCGQTRRVLRTIFARFLQYIRSRRRTRPVTDVLERKDLLKNAAEER